MFAKLQSLFRIKPQEHAGSALLQHSVTDPRPTILVTVLCADAAARARAIEKHATSRSHRPIFVVCDADVRAYQDAGCAFEYLPEPSMVRTMSGVGDWAAYLQERWCMINSKWLPKWTAEYGLSYTQYLKKCTVDGKQVL